MPKVKKKYNLALALGGGGARGLAHIGVLKALVKANIPIDLIVGTSMGAIVGGMYAQTGDIEAAERRALELIDEIMEEKKWLQIVDSQKEVSNRSLLSELSNYVQKRYLGFKALTRIAIEPKESLYEPLTKLLDDKPVEDCKIPFAAVSLDLIGGDTQILTSGSIVDAVYASSAIEGIFPPLDYNGRLLGDGGPVNITPVEIARKLDSGRVVAVDVHHRIKRVDRFANGLEVIMRADNIGLDRLRQTDLAKADLVISPNVGTIHWANFNKARECIRRGEQAAEMMMPELVEMLRPEGFIKQLKRGLGLLFRDLSERD